ncbi:MAG TPA: tRNA (adenosine(37)-N6)-threonylcarbamoyltransferase complex ATPase subunit type 1 TsaE [Candidatus Nanoperiomorbaceae bacterium]|nr:tRNA (adenosine(37)-N6)-threonylcarbamoyltransferase complex ATPase subunit type 1 TsaE [Candidatus Nanoperiomorbaceae bacterium]HMQ97130.1 tRNA (adenosine(37)-N6)-threonylcarbamoyltransferase complex ATPase subunit type 1 TsaE [Candidatus Nanoperiomorbaceae bacterium]HMR86372.1 tRNA (adenosine(37)-N6)-threonylcarbamoyltransferase complex ATPase subunit type 1 TsaE [Candidatus Nanoperiomorbaceae bacterium]HMU12263.1 tRNA (adenosine(37)-N6)-threonylcarbamoyltransferase complex ATPase subunit t
MIIPNDESMRALGVKIGAALHGGEVFELIGDVGAGKTTFVKGLAAGLAIDDDVQSPSFTINRRYKGRDELILSHYDFYRLNDAGIMNMEVAESLSEPGTITVVEWGESIKDVLPSSRIVITINYLPDEGRTVEIQLPESAGYLNDTME